MKTFTKFTTLLLVLFFTNSLISQTLESPWALYPRECNLNTSPPEIFLLPEADENYNEPYNDANAAYTPNGNLVFFMLNEGLYDAAGEFIGPLSFIGDMILPETNILPVPGSSNHFYLIYAAATLPAGNSVSYAIVNCENNEYEITSNGIPIAEQPGGNLVGLAVSPLMPDNSHRLYISDNEGIKRYKIGDIESGIEFVENILTTPGGYQTRQLELSTDCKKLAWGGAWGMRYDGSKLSIIELNQNGSYASNYSIPITDGVYEPNSSAVISGVEFSYDNTKVYVSIQGGTTSSPTGGLFCYNFNTSDVTSLVYNDYSITHLQKDTKGNIYAVANDGSNLGKITTANNNFNPSFQSINIFSNGLEYTLGDYYSLPDLIDHFDLEATISIVPESCANTYDGEATVIVNGGVSPYTYLWDDPLGQTTPTATGLTTGIYHVTVTDAINNTFTIEANVPTNPLLFTHIGDIDVVTQQTISGFAAIDGNIQVLDGGSLTLDGQIEFNANKGITVNAGGTLIINNNSTISGLTACGNNFWDGIAINNDADIVINGSFTLSRGDLILEPGAVVNLSQKTIALKDNKIIIKSSEGSLPGAKLTLNASTLTTVGTDTWKGIEVWGDEDKAQLPDIYGNYYQGFLEMKNLSLIENSLDGIELWKPADYTKTGGIIKAYNSTFRNNAKPIHALLYPKFYSAEFIKCTFEITETYHGTATFYKHIDLNQVRGFRFIGCHFSVDPAAPNVSPYNAGIMSFNSGFTTTGYCTSQTIPCTAYENSSFDGFYSAVYASGTNSPYTFSVINSTFTNNTCGVKVNAVNNFAVLWSDFYIGYNTADDNECDGQGMTAASYGINASASTGFAIEENYFTKAQGAPAGNYVGIRIYETKNIDQIYMNQFENLSYGNYTEGKNWKGYQSYDGLAFYCNENTGNFADFYVAGGGLHGSGVQSFQGSATHPAGNTFSQSGATWHFYNGGDHPIIYYYDNSKNANPAEKPDQALLYNVFPFGINVPTVCLSHYGGIGGTTDGGSLVLTPDELLEAEQLFSTSLNDFNNIQALYNQLKDGGNTEALKTEVETTFPSEMWEMRDELLAKSPHLTFEVLKATVDKTDVFPNAVLMEILSANPDELRNKELLTYLTEKENPLPEYMIDILRQVAGGITYRTVLEQQMSALNQSKTRAANDIVRSLLNDSITDMAALRTWLTNIGGQRANEQIIATYLQEGNQQEALALATMLPDLHNYDAPAMSEHTMYMNLLNLQVQMNQQGKPLTNLDSTEVNSLVAIAENGKGTAGAMARGLLESNYGYHFCDCITAESNNGFKSGSVYNAKTLQQIIGGSIEVNPNPATDWTNFNYTLPVMDSKGEIVISDVTGTVVQKFTVSAMQGNQIWDTRNIKPGVYYYMFTVDGFSQNGKIVVTH